MHRLNATIALGVAVILSGCDDTTSTGGGGSNRIDRTFDWEGTIAVSQQLEIRGINGSITAERAPGRLATVHATIYGSASLASQVVVEVVEHPNGVLVCARYPEIWGSLAPCEVNGGGGSVQARNVRVDFAVGVPDNVSLLANVVNGNVTADTEDDVVALVVNGDVDIDTHGTAAATIVNGSIDASMGTIDWGRDLLFKSVNGSIRVAIRREVDVRVDGITLNGRIRADFPLSITTHGSMEEMHGTLGAGTWDLELSTVNGDVTLRARN